jgi:hypothetical protein
LIQGTDSARPCSLAGRYDNPIPSSHRLFKNSSTVLYCTVTVHWALLKEQNADNSWYSRNGAATAKITATAGTQGTGQQQQRPQQQLVLKERGNNSKDHSNSWYSRSGAATTKNTATAGTQGTGQQQQRPQQQLVLKERGSNSKDHSNSWYSRNGAEMLYQQLGR